MKGFAGLPIIGLVLIALFFTSQALSHLPITQDIAFIRQVASFGIMLPVGFYLMFMASPKIAFILVFGSALFMIFSGLPLLGG